MELIGQNQSEDVTFGRVLQVVASGGSRNKHLYCTRLPSFSLCSTDLRLPTTALFIQQLNSVWRCIV